MWQAIRVLTSVRDDCPVFWVYCEIQGFEAVFLDEIVNDLLHHMFNDMEP
jgi:hypothetical protein